MSGQNMSMSGQNIFTRGQGTSSIGQSTLMQRQMTFMTGQNTLMQRQGTLMSGQDTFTRGQRTLTLGKAIRSGKISIFGFPVWFFVRDWVMRFLIKQELYPQSASLKRGAPSFLNALSWNPCFSLFAAGVRGFNQV